MGEVVSNPTYPIIRDKISQLKSHADREKNVVPILVAPYLNPQKRKECRESGVYYMDLSGNIYLEHESLYVEREGLPNRFPEERKGILGCRPDTDGQHQWRFADSFAAPNILNIVTIVQSLQMKFRR